MVMLARTDFSDSKTFHICKIFCLPEVPFLAAALSTSIFALSMLCNLDD